MKKEVYKDLSQEGIALLNDPALSNTLSVIAKSAGVSAKEYLMRFEEVLSTAPDSIINIFEAHSLKFR